jgi:hypothetical protein
VSTFTLLPDDPRTPTEPTTRQLRLVTTGLAPTAEVPGARAQPERPACYLPCPTCGAQVLVGRTKAGKAVALDLGPQTYIVDFPAGADAPTLHESRGYPVHGCQQAALDQAVAAQTTALQEEVREAWAAFNNAYATLTATEAENAKLREHNARLVNADLRCLGYMIEIEQLKRDVAQAQQAGQSPEICRQLTQLCHPDKWSQGQPATELAHELMVALNAMK